MAEGVVKLRNLVGGEWVDSLSGRVAPVLNPATADVIALAPVGGVGSVWINDHLPLASEMPWTGMKQSGYGRDMSKYALEDYSQVKHVMAKLG